MKYQIGDVIHTIDGIDYDGNSASYFKGFATEILACMEDRYLIRNFYRAIEEQEIQNLVITNTEKCKQYKKELSFYGRNVIIQTDVLTFKEVIIQYYSFQYHKFMYVELCIASRNNTKEEHHLQIHEFWPTLLDAYKEKYEELIHGMCNIRKLTNYTTENKKGCVTGKG